MKIYKSCIGKYFLIFAIVPVVFIGVLITTIATNVIKKAKYDDTRELLKCTASELVYSYELFSKGGNEITEVNGDIYCGDVKITGNYDIVDRMKTYSGAEVSIFYHDKRLLTTIKNSAGERYINTSATEIWQKVSTSHAEYFDSNIEIDGEKYYGYYVPIHSANGDIIGMGFAGMPTSTLKTLVRKLNRVCIIICVIFCVLNVICSIVITRRILGMQNGIITYLKEIDEGKYEHNMNERLVERKDEFGIMGRSFVKMNNSLVSLILKDGLTDLYNRRAAMNKLEKFVVDANRVGGDTFTFAICDIDLFKRVNDTYGHNCGDEVLKMVSSKLAVAEEKGGFAARWGGEEFVIALKGNKESNISLIQDIADSIKTSEVTYDKYKVQITMTFGVTMYHAPEKLDSVISRADNLLYKGKEGGRDQIVA